MPQYTENPLDRPQAWDQLVAKGQGHTGIFRLAPDTAARVYKWDVRDAPAMQGAIMTYRGWRPSLDIKGTFAFWETSQVEKFYKDYLPIWYLDSKGRASPVSVYHPALQGNDITMLVPVKIGELTGSAVNGWVINVTWHEYRQAKIITPRTPEGADASKVRPSILDKLDAELAKEAARAERPL